MRVVAGHELRPPSEAEGLRALVGAWLRAFGPGTEADLKWWLGSTLTAVRRALAELGAVEVDLGGATRLPARPTTWSRSTPVEPWAALLPPLDPTTMGWIDRDWYLGPLQGAALRHHGQRRARPMWWDGRIVGGWRQHATRRGRAAAAGGRRRRCDAGVRGRGRAAHRVVRRRAGAAAVPLAALEGARLARPCCASKGPAGAGPLDARPHDLGLGFGFGLIWKPACALRALLPAASTALTVTR